MEIIDNRFYLDKNGREIPGLVLMEPMVFYDSRGYFYESYNKAWFDFNVGQYNFVQDNESRSSYGVLRGFHYQAAPYTQAKLVRVVRGEVLDVVVDLRAESDTFGHTWHAFLSGENQRQFFIPEGFAHAFLCLRDDTVFQYKCSNFYNKESERCIRYDDPFIGFDWSRYLDTDRMIVSEKDKKGLTWDESEKL